ncbi:demethylrebeccamycin-D-glucose O-methyltransferase [Peptococcaceae bacterium CEB3]|nr:demethylrebeccamycin-D-glucose O-methyltransferase [Peptococcaceae bacterium CEB3]
MSEVVFDRAATDYDAWYETEVGRTVDRVERTLIQGMFKPPGERVLEVGCGTGQYTTWLAGLGYEVTAVDVSTEMMAKAQAKSPGTGAGVRWWQADIHEILDQLGKFHGILAVTSFEFISQPQRVLNGLYRCLEPGGCLVIGVIAGGSPWSEFYRVVAGANPESVFARANFYTPEEIARWQVGGNLRMGRALYFPPDVKTEAEALALEEKKEGRPGFIAARWAKEG